MPNACRLALAGYLTLFLELTLIRYLPTTVWNLGFFPNFVLISVFVGLGIGFVFHRLFSPRASATAFVAAGVVLCLVVVLVTQARPRVPGIGSRGGQLGEELFFSVSESTSSAALYVFPVLFPLLGLIFALIAQRTAKLFADFRPLTAYTLDIAGSCLGILSFMLVSQFQVPAWIWFLALVPMFVLVAPRVLDVQNIPLVAALAASVVLVWRQDQQLLFQDKPARPDVVAWSPYQKVECAFAQGQDNMPFVFVNGIMHQQMKTLAQLGTEFYQTPHDRRKDRGLPPYRNVLILGAGTGNDVAVALRNGAAHVDAVEIDPVIAQLGRRYHPSFPYDNPRVTLTVDDGRAFVTRAQGPYDLIIFALTDSLVKISPLAQLRLENYLFTEESIRRAYNLLSPDGELVFYNWYREPWLVDKLKHMIYRATGSYPSAQFQLGNFIGLVASRRPPPADQVAAVPAPAEILPAATDDWPFLYLRRPSIAPIYRVAMGALAIVVVVLLAALRVIERRRGDGPLDTAGILLRAAFLLMGAAFLLLETKGVIQFSLLFGTTWRNNSLVFLAVLASVLLANWVATLIESPRALPVIFVLLVASCLVTLVWPLAGLLAVENQALRFALASLMTFSPIFFANLIFSISFRDQPAAERLFGWNLLGATLGGVIEYSSMVLGYNALAILVAVLYALVFLALTFSRRQPAPRAALPAAA